MLWLKIADHTFDHTFGAGMVLDCRGEITELRPPAEADDLHVSARLTGARLAGVCRMPLLSKALGFSDLFRCDPLRNEVSVFDCIRQLRL